MPLPSNRSYYGFPYLTTYRHMCEHYIDSGYLYVPYTGTPIADERTRLAKINAELARLNGEVAERPASVPILTYL
jgi:hypothetical protein